MLTDKAVRAAVAKDKAYKIADSQGLFLHISPAGRKTWRLKFRLAGKEQLLTFGSYPEVSLRDARDQRDAARKLVRDGRDPRFATKRAKLVAGSDAIMTFEAAARRWHTKKSPKWTDVHKSDVIRSLERDVFPDLGAMPLDEITKPVLLAVLRKIEDRGSIETARRVKQRVAQVFRFGAAEGIEVINPALDINDALQPLPKAKRYPALVDVDALRVMLFDIDRAGASPVTRLAARMLALTAQRPGMVRRMQWSEISGIDWTDIAADPHDALWTIPAEKIKQEFHLRQDESFSHPVPLARQAVDVLRAVRWLTGNSAYVFPSARSNREPMSENAIGYLFNREGYKGRHVPHGWRSSFSTIMNEIISREHGYASRHVPDRLVLDLMLAHIPKGLSSSEMRYHRAEYLTRRRELAALWADLIMKDALPAGEILPTPRRKPRL